MIDQAKSPPKPPAKGTTKKTVIDTTATPLLEDGSSWSAAGVVTVSDYPNPIHFKVPSTFPDSDAALDAAQKEGQSIVDQLKAGVDAATLVAKYAPPADASATPTGL